MGHGSKKFRETLWFKRGAIEGEAETPTGDDDEVDHPNIGVLPIEDRYLEDGSVTRADTLSYSVRTGSTQCVPVMNAPAPTGDDAAVGVDVLVADLRRGRGPVFVMLGVGATALGALMLGTILL